MKLNEISDPIIEALCCNEALRRVNFEPEEIFVGFYDGDPVCIDGQMQSKLIVIRPVVQDKPAVDLYAPAPEYDKARFDAEWPLAVAAWNAGAAASDPFLMEKWERSKIRSRSVEMIHLLTKAGIYRPAVIN